MEMDSTTAIAEIALVSDMSGVCSSLETFWMTCRPTNVASMKTNSIDQNSEVAIIWFWTITHVFRGPGPSLTFSARRRPVDHERDAPGRTGLVPDSRHRRAVDSDPRPRHRGHDDDV